MNDVTTQLLTPYDKIGIAASGVLTGVLRRVFLLPLVLAFWTAFNIFGIDCVYLTKHTLSYQTHCKSTASC